MFLSLSCDIDIAAMVNKPHFGVFAEESFVFDASIPAALLVLLGSNMPRTCSTASNRFQLDTDAAASAATTEMTVLFAAYASADDEV